MSRSLVEADDLAQPSPVPSETNSPKAATGQVDAVMADEIICFGDEEDEAAGTTVALTAEEILAANARFGVAIRRRLSGPGFRTFLNIADLWLLTEAQRLTVLGIPSPSTYSAWAKEAREEHCEIMLTVEVLTRISAVLGIHQALGILQLPHAEAAAWLRTPHKAAAFDGKPPLTLMINNGLEGLLFVRRFLDAASGQR